ncbi:MAG: FliG C-terminal domain-containing protein [Candidatus Binataceae bacterium]
MATTINGLDRAVLLLQALDREAMSKIINLLTVQEIALIRRHLEVAGLQPGESEVQSVLRQFLLQTGSTTSDYLREILSAAVGPEGEEEMERRSRWQALVERVSPEAMAALLKGERPETVAVALSHFPAHYSGEILSCFSEEQRLESIERLSRGVRVAVAVADAILSALEASLSRETAAGGEAHGNAAEYTAQVLNQIDAHDADRVVELIAARDLDLAKSIQQEMFHFEDLLRLDSRTLQAVLAEVKPERLALALKGMPPELEATVMTAMTADNQNILREEVAALGPVPVREVQAARQEINALALELEHAGKIRVRRSEEMVA